MSQQLWGDNEQLLSIVDNATAGSSEYPPRGRWGPRIQPNLQFVLVDTGHVNIQVDDQDCFVPARYIALLHPGHREDFYFAENTETWHRWIHIQVNDIDPDTFRKLETLPRCIPLSDAMNHLTDTIQALTHSLIDQRAHQELRCTLAVVAIMLYQTESQYGWLEKGKHPSVVQAKAEIHKSYHDDLDLSKLAAISNVSSEYLIRLFRQSEGFTPMRYLWKVRVDHALELLHSTGLSLAEIAEQTGFKSVYHLSRMIKRFSGQTPTEVRQSGLRASNTKYM